jgi:hypothetical protein
VAIGRKPRKIEEILRRDHWLKLVETGAGRAVYDAGHLTLYIEERMPHPPVPSFNVECLSDAKRRLLEGGCEIVVERKKSVYFKDPSGVVFDAIES